MTVDTKVESVAIIGGGPAGIASLYELLHTLNDGTSIVGKPHSQYLDQLAFPEITLFERNSSTGGHWNLELAGKERRDPLLPKLEGDFNNAETIYGKIDIPILDNASYEKPVSLPKSSAIRWNNSGVYEGLFTNLGDKYMTFSYQEPNKLVREPNSILGNLLNYKVVGEYLNDVIEQNELRQYIRLNSAVEKLSKSNGKWEIVIRETRDDKDLWYVEKFDAVIIANGRTIPYVPKFDGILEYQANNPQIFISHSKSIPNPNFLQQKEKILFIGGSISSTDLIQYCFPRLYEPETVFLSRTKINSDRAEWVDHLAYSLGIANKPEVARFHSNGDVEFVDGSIESGFDTVILGTGYHSYFPFIDESSANLTDFYLQIFSIDDPTLALNGNSDLPLLFSRNELNAAAIAGVWSGHKHLPRKGKQLAWLAKPTFPFKFWNIKKYYIDYLLEKYAPLGRLNPLEKRKEHVRDFADAEYAIKKIFYGIKSGEYKLNEIK